jgi:hypothetical protein
MHHVAKSFISWKVFQTHTKSRQAYDYATNTKYTFCFNFWIRGTQNLACYITNIWKFAFKYLPTTIKETIFSIDASIQWYNTNFDFNKPSFVSLCEVKCPKHESLRCINLALVEVYWHILDYETWTLEST